MRNELLSIILIIVQAILNPTKPAKTNSNEEGLILRKNKEIKQESKPPDSEKIYFFFFFLKIRIWSKN